MACLWVTQRADASSTGEPRSGEWAVMPLVGGAVALGGDREGPDCIQRGGSVLLLRSRGAFGDVWLAMSATPHGVCLNGSPLHTGIRVLDDRDELRLEGVGRVFFSTETLAVVEPFPGDERPVLCPRCKQEIAAATAAVRCPQCGVWHHQSERWLCWTYAPHCSLCPQATPLDGGYRWTPEGL